MNRSGRAVLLVLCILNGCLARAGEKAPFKHATLGVANGCFIESVCFYDHVQELFGPEVWVRVLQWGAKEGEEIVAGHAVAIFEYKGRLWAWDINFGFMQLDVSPDFRDNIALVASPVVARYPHIEPRYPLYRFDFPQNPTEHPPEVLATNEERSFRDATLAGARLGAHRPVNVVRFSYIGNGETKQSAAVVFIFHGQLFVYFPE
ncbi:MAG: hypothetical protein KGJ37_01875, partial [Verrucomicrobiota bacterium]|nr:hypothetical protein [Verrucomicrobiota bacterium]